MARKTPFIAHTTLTNTQQHCESDQINTESCLVCYGL